MWGGIRALIKSFTYAWRGFTYAYRHEQNFRIQLVIALLVIILMALIPVEQWEAVALIFVIVAVLALELLNTIVEKFLDLLKPRLHEYSKMIKDMMAAVVFLSAIGSAVVGIIIFYPYIFGS